MEEASDSTMDGGTAWAQDKGGNQDKASVMEPYVKGMRHLKVVGLPVRISVKDGGVVTFSDRFRRTKCGVKVGNNVIYNKARSLQLSIIKWQM